MDPLSCITNFVFYETGLKQADVILIPGGARRQLMERAAELYHWGLAPFILPSGGPNPRIPEYPSEWQYLRETGTELGVPESAILKEDTASNTFENARFSMRVLQDAGIPVAKAILVCKTFHAMRAYLTYSSAFPPGVEFFVSPVVDDRALRRDNWYLDPEKTRIVLDEVRKIGEYFPSEIPKLVENARAAGATERQHATRQRAAVIIVKDGKVALVRREHATGKAYYLFPGGHVEKGESLEQAATREAREELGVMVRLGHLAAIVEHGDSEQYYYLAEPVSGDFGTGKGPEMGSPGTSQQGSHTPVWLGLSDLLGNDVRPAALARALASGLTLSGLPLRIRD